jgi:hypothetical protein
LIQINAPVTPACDSPSTLTDDGVEDRMDCRIRYDFIAQTRTVLDDATPLCAGREPTEPDVPRPDVLRPNGEADRLVERHVAMLAALVPARSYAEEAAAA